MKRRRLKYFFWFGLTILIVVLSNINSFALIYYVSTSGNDRNSGIKENEPWRSLAKVNRFAFRPGDQILFKRGDEWTGTITVKASGTSPSPITYGAYGSGTKPVISGFTTITGWTDEGGGIYSKVITADAQTNMVTIDGINTAMGRTPNAGTYNTYESFSTNVSITDTGIGDNPNWEGAELVIRKNAWTWDRCLITDHTGDTFAYTSLGGTATPTAAGYGYFLQNDLRTLDEFGEWYHDISTGKFYMYFGAVDPSTKTVKVATKTHIIANIEVSNNAQDYITIRDLQLEGAINCGVYIGHRGTYNRIENCDISYCGENGVQMRYLSNNNTVNNNTISECISGGIVSTSPGVDSEYTTVTNNTVTNIGLIIGASKGTLNGGYSAISVGSTYSLIQYNTVSNAGNNGISSQYGDNSFVLNNVIDNTLLVVDDGAGIYTNGQVNGMVIDGNIISNTIGYYEGTTGTYGQAFGIYLDDYAEGVTVTNNTAFNNRNGIAIHKGFNNTIKNNTFFNNETGIFLNNSSSVSSMVNNVIKENIVVAREIDQITLRFRSLSDDAYSFGVSDSNYFARPVDDTDYIRTYMPADGTNNRTLAGWQAVSKQDGNSIDLPLNFKDTINFIFEYNTTDTIKSIELSGKMIDIKGKKYIGEIPLQPYTSIILFKDPTAAHVPDSPTSVTATAGNASALVSFEAPVSNGGSLVDGYVVTSDPTGGIDSNAGSTSLSHTITGLSNGKSYTFTVKAINSVGSSMVSAASNPVVPVPSKLTEYKFICEGDNYNGWTTTGTYIRTLVAEAGGDSIVTTILSVTPSFSVSESITIYEGESYQGWTTSGEYERTLTSSTGCDSIVTTRLKVKQLQSQYINLENGWNIFSSYLIPFKLSLDSVLENLQIQNQLIEVQDEDGKTFRKSDIGWTNNIGEMQETEGYKIRVQYPCVLEIRGQPVSLPMNIRLNKGLNIISFPYPGEADAIKVIQALIDNGVLEKVQDEKGNSIEYWEDNIGWINGIGNFIAGKGYIVEVNRDVEIIIPEEYEKSGLTLPDQPELVYFKKIFEGNGFGHMNINIKGLYGSIFQVGDEIAAYDGSHCVGAVKLRETNFENDIVSIHASVSDADKINGFTEGNTIGLRTWQTNTNKEFQLQPIAIKGNTVYQKHGSVFFQIEEKKTIENTENQWLELNIYPNPANDKVTIQFPALPEPGTKIFLTDIRGKQVSQKEVKTKLEHLFLDSYPSGIYFLKIISAEHYNIKKLIIN